LSGCGYLGIDLLGLTVTDSNPRDSSIPMDADTTSPEAGPNDAAMDAMVEAGPSDSGSDGAIASMDSGYRADAGNCDGMCDPPDTGPVVPCDTTPITFAPGAYSDIAVPAGCTRVTVELWGGGGASGGKTVPWSSGKGGRGGAGGYATSVVGVSSALTLLVGSGGASECAAGGSIPDTSLPEASRYLGGAAGSGNGSNGADGVVAGGGIGGDSESGGDGGRGYYGGGGGGHGEPSPVPSSPAGGGGGGGGAASALLVGGVLTVVAGGGGGSGGELGAWYGSETFSTGGSGGEGCSGSGLLGAGSESGAGGGGGVCFGMVTHAGAEGLPYSTGPLPAGQATGATEACAAGGGGYAILTFGS
jgi:hypothetical protein